MIVPTNPYEAERKANLNESLERYSPMKIPINSPINPPNGGNKIRPIIMAAKPINVDLAAAPATLELNIPDP